MSTYPIRSSNPPRRPLDLGWLIVAGAVVVVVILSVHAITAKSFWYDEAISLKFARMAPDRLFATLTEREANGWLYYAALSVWRSLGDGEARIRFLSVLCAAATVPLLFLVGRRHIGSLAAALACVMFAFHPFVIEYAQEARMYTMAMLLVTAAALAWSHATETDRAGWWAVYVVLAIAGILTHFFCGFVVVGLGMTWLLGVVPRTRNGFISQVAIVVVCLPVANFVASLGFGQIAWILPISDGGVVTVLGALGAGSLTLSWILFGGALVAIPTRDPDKARRLAPLIAWMTTPIVGGIVISFYQSLLQDRYFIVSLPPLLLLASAGFVRIGSATGRERGRAVMAAAGAVVVIALAVGPLIRWYDAPRWDWRAAADWVTRTAEPGDRITYIPISGRDPFVTYLARGQGQGPVEASVEELRAVPGRAWLVLYIHRGVSYGGLEATLPGFEVVESKMFDGVRVQLIEPSG